jgi:hypothetical protein
MRSLGIRRGSSPRLLQISLLSRSQNGRQQDKKKKQNSSQDAA